MISTVTVTAIPVAKIPPIVLPAMHPPPQPKLHNNNVHTCVYVKLKLTYVHTYAHKYHQYSTAQMQFCTSMQVI